MGHFPDDPEKRAELILKWLIYSTLLYHALYHDGTPSQDKKISVMIDIVRLLSGFP